MKICVTGVSSSGKTTLSKELAARLAYPWISEGCNGAFEEAEKRGIKFTTHDFSQMTPLDHLYFEVCLMSSRRDIEAKQENFVADGGPLLWSSYILIKSSLAVDEVKLDSILGGFTQQVHSYDFVWYLPTGAFPIVTDGYRIDNRNFLFAQDAILRRLVEKYNDITTHCKPTAKRAKIISLKATHPEYRLEEILTVLRSHD